ncbi:hypothetical protein GN958_ATG00869 [Phytophthora infestans]|uniref:HTH psq-type domain-containing protein n=1 Tax=Phytophthora infestans TaxID=4787 RepID=A0A8S9VAC4_PHYIN|nr:hypothetical protein GN958_ATG00869 [Phytophthora infestans]
MGRTSPNKNRKKQEAKAQGISQTLADEYDVNRTTLWCWVQDAKRVEVAAKEKPNKTFVTEGKRGPKPRFLAMDRRLLNWVIEMRANKSRCKKIELYGWWILGNI